MRSCQFTSISRSFSIVRLCVLLSVAALAPATAGGLAAGSGVESSPEVAVAGLGRSASEMVGKSAILYVVGYVVVCSR